MKKLTIYALIISLTISLMYSFKIYWLIETDAEFYRATALTLVSEIGLWCAYYFARDYEYFKEQEEAKERLRQFLEHNRK